MPAIQKAALRTRKQDKARAERQHTKDRRACVEAVWHRAGGRCEWRSAGRRCNRGLMRGGVFWGVVGQVDEILSKSRGGSDTDVANCRLLCPRHHFSGPSGAHRRHGAGL